MASHLANLNMPSRDEIMRLSEDVNGLDRRLDRIERTLNQILNQTGESTPKKKGPARTKQPPKAKKKES